MQTITGTTLSLPSDDFYAIKKYLEESHIVYKATPKTVYEYVEAAFKELGKLRFGRFDVHSREEAAAIEAENRCEEARRHRFISGFLASELPYLSPFPYMGLGSVPEITNRPDRIKKNKKTRRKKK